MGGHIVSDGKWKLRSLGRAIASWLPVLQLVEKRTKGECCIRQMRGLEMLREVVELEERLSVCEESQGGFPLGKEQTLLSQDVIVFGTEERDFLRGRLEQLELRLSLMRVR